MKRLHIFLEYVLTAEKNWCSWLVFLIESISHMICTIELSPSDTFYGSYVHVCFSDAGFWHQSKKKDHRHHNHHPPRASSQEEPWCQCRGPACSCCSSQTVLNGHQQEYHFLGTLVIQWIVKLQTTFVLMCVVKKSFSWSYKSIVKKEQYFFFCIKHACLIYPAYMLLSIFAVTLFLLMHPQSK